MRVHMTLNNTEGDYIMLPLNQYQKRYYQTEEGRKIAHKEVILQTTAQQDSKLLKHENLAEFLINDDPDIDLEVSGKFVHRKNRIYVGKDFKPVYNYEMVDILTKPDGNVLERPHLTRQANIFTETPLVLLNKFEHPNTLALQFIFTKHYYIRHYNGVTFEFLYNLAKKLQDEGRFQQVQAFNPETKKSTPILVTTGGSLYARAYLEGRIREKSYCLILHLSDREFKIPEGGA